MARCSLQKNRMLGVVIQLYKHGGGENPNDLVSKHCANLTSGLHNAVSCPLIFTNEVRCQYPGSDLFYPLRCGFLI